MQGKPIAFSREDSERVQAHRRRCKSLPPLRPGEHERLVKEFLAVRSVTMCPTRYAAPVERPGPATVNGMR
jgi:hypothetical protein